MPAVATPFIRASLLGLLLSLVTLSQACDPYRSVHFVLTPQLAAPSDSVQRGAFDVAQHVAARYRVTQVGRATMEKTDRSQCVFGQGVKLCVIPTDSQVLIELVQAGAIRSFSPVVEQLRGELVDSLEKRFGPHGVQECEIKYTRDSARSNFWYKSYLSTCVPRASGVAAPYRAPAT